MLIDDVLTMTTTNDEGEEKGKRKGGRIKSQTRARTLERNLSCGCLDSKLGLGMDDPERVAADVPDLG